jgi:ABC transporter substrate binding protein
MGWHASKPLPVAAVDAVLSVNARKTLVTRLLMAQRGRARSLTYETARFGVSADPERPAAPESPALDRVAAHYVDEILKGARPGDLPIRHPARYFLTINASAAKNLGLILPPALLAEADRILP